MKRRRKEEGKRWMWLKGVGTGRGGEMRWQGGERFQQEEQFNEGNKENKKQTNDM